MNGEKSKNIDWRGNWCYFDGRRLNKSKRNRRNALSAPYIGITGFTDKREVEDVLCAMPKRSKRKLMVGVLASSDTLRGRLNAENPNRYPPVGDISKIFTDHPRALNLIHYDTKDPDRLLRQLIMATSVGGVDLHGLALDIAWPLPSVLKAYRDKHPDKIIVLKIGQEALETVGRSFATLLRRITEKYAGLIDYVTLDASAKEYEPLDTKLARIFLQAFSFNNLNLGLGVSGGLSAENLKFVRPLTFYFQDFNIDADSGLRDGSDNLDMGEAVRYVKDASLMFSASTP